MKKTLRFIIISALVLAVYLPIFWFLVMIIWRFNILSLQSYQEIIDQWNRGHTFKTFGEYSLALVIILFPLFWLRSSKKLYKFGLGKFLLLPITKIYRMATKPKSLEVEHVSIKNLGGKGKTLDDIIAAKIKSENKAEPTNQYFSKDLRKQISAKIEENEKQ